MNIHLANVQSYDIPAKSTYNWVPMLCMLPHHSDQPFQLLVEKKVSSHKVGQADFTFFFISPQTCLMELLGLSYSALEKATTSEEHRTCLDFTNLWRILLWYPPHLFLVVGGVWKKGPNSLGPQGMGRGVWDLSVGGGRPLVSGCSGLVPALGLPWSFPLLRYHMRS